MQLKISLGTYTTAGLECFFTNSAVPGAITSKRLILSTLVGVFSRRKSPAFEYSLIRLITMIKITAYAIRVRFGNYKDSTGLTTTIIVNPVRRNAKIVATTEPKLRYDLRTRLKIIH